MKISDVKKANNLIGKFEEMLESWQSIADDARAKLDERSDKYVESDKGTMDDTNITAIEGFCEGLQSCLDALADLQSDNY